MIGSKTSAWKAAAFMTSGFAQLGVGLGTACTSHKSSARQPDFTVHRLCRSKRATTSLFNCPAQTPMLLRLNVHPSRVADLSRPTDRLRSGSADAFILDLFGNRVMRVEVPAGIVAFSNRFVIRDSGKPDETPPDVRTTTAADLPRTNGKQ